MTEKQYIGLDLLRFLSVIAIVWFHAGAPGAEIAHAGLPALLLISLVLPIIRDKGKPMGPIIAKRADRLLVPWFFWSLVYGSYFAQHALRAGEPFSSEFQAWMIFTGPMIHLWYLPFAFFGSLSSLILFRLVGSWPQLVTVPVLLTASCLLLWARTESHLGTPPLSQWFLGSVSIPLSVAIGIVMRKTDEARQRHLLGLIWILFVIVVALLVVCIRPQHCLPYGIGFTFVCLFLLWSPRLARLTKKLNDVTFGIYILHPVVFALLTNKMMVGNPYQPIVAAFVATAVSWTATALLRMTPLRRFL